MHIQSVIARYLHHTLTLTHDIHYSTRSIENKKDRLDMVLGSDIYIGQAIQYDSDDRKDTSPSYYRIRRRY